MNALASANKTSQSRGNETSEHTNKIHKLHGE